MPRIAARARRSAGSRVGRATLRRRVHAARRVHAVQSVTRESLAWAGDDVDGRSGGGGGGGGEGVQERGRGQGGGEAGGRAGGRREGLRGGAGRESLPPPGT